MLTSEPTEEMIREWKDIFLQYKDKITPNRIIPQKLVDYIAKKYSLLTIVDTKYDEILIHNETSNILYKNKMIRGNKPEPVIFELQNTGLGKEVYRKQDEIFKKSKIIIGVDLSTGFFIVEGSSYIWNEMLAYRGLDNDELNNFYLVAEYINCLKIFDKDNELLKMT